MSLSSEGQSLLANQIPSTYLNWRLRYNYFRFWKTNVSHIENLLSVSISTICQNPHIILRQATEFRPNRSTHCGNMTSYPFLQMVAATAEYCFWFRMLKSLPSEGQSLLANYILSRYLKWRLRYNYFRFRNTYVRHIGILLMILMWTSLP